MYLVFVVIFTLSLCLSLSPCAQARQRKLVERMHRKKEDEQQRKRELEEKRLLEVEERKR